MDKGMLWVLATLMPLAAFVVEVLLGRRLGKAASYLATAAIGGACVLSTIGILNYIVFERPHSVHPAHHGHNAAHGAEAAAHVGEAGHGEGEPEVHGGEPGDDLVHADEHGPVYSHGSIEWAQAVFNTESRAPRAFQVGYYIDNITVLMFFMVTLIATCIHLYSIGYMSHEPRFSRFFTYLSLFCFSMLALVVSDNFFQVFICWELVGVCSYFLIGFYYEKRSASNAANKAFITNRVGDVGFIIGLMVLFAHTGTFSFTELFTPEGKLNPQLQISEFWLTVAGLGIFVGCVGKSAQFPLQVWLPDAMEGPTPVSALIHAATMVAAGVYLVARSFPLFTPDALLVIMYVGGITLFLAATIAIVATDIKKALAYSTISQLGYMMFALGIGGWVAGLMHLITHAFFKALLFLCSGSVIHGCGTQEMPQMGGLVKKMPITAYTMLIGVLAIAGFPLTSGFYSKDAIIAHTLAYAGSHPIHSFVLTLPIITAGITTFYMFRLWFMTFVGEPRDEHVHDHAHESPPIMYVPLLILSFFAVVIAGIPQFTFLENFISFGMPGAVDTNLLQSAHDLHWLATVVASGTAIVGFALAAAVYWRGMLNPEDACRQFSGIYKLLVNKWYFDELYRYLFVRPALVFSKVVSWMDTSNIDGLVNRSAKDAVMLSKLSGLFDLKIIDGIANWIADSVFHGGLSLKVLQTGWLRGYVMVVAVGAAGLVVVGTVLFNLM